MHVFHVTVGADMSTCMYFTRQWVETCRHACISHDIGWRHVDMHVFHVTVGADMSTCMYFTRQWVETCRHACISHDSG